MSAITTIAGCRIFDGETFHEDSALVVRNGIVDEIAPVSNMQSLEGAVRIEGGLIAPGFIDLQVNGGGGRLFNDDPGAGAIAEICQAHMKLGTTSLMVTLITDTAAKTRQAIDAAIAAQESGIPGFLGLHLEGPHLSVAKKGAHDPALIRDMTQDDLDLLLHAAGKLAQLMVTVAPESVSLEQISDLSAAGVIVSIGHSNAGYQLVCDAAGAGARCFTHLYNAMSPLTNREPGVVGAALMSGDLHAGLIADGFHVHPAAIRIALDAKRGPGRIFLVSDAMSVAGTDIGSFKLGERTIFRRDGRLTLSDGTLAGADLDMGKAVKYLAETVGVDLGEALKMASQYPAQCVGAPETYGHLKPGAVADFVHLDDALQVRGVWKRGTPVD